MKPNPLLQETFVFRPVSKVDLRYAEGSWIPDDGKPDLAFVSNNFAFYVDMPYQTNMLWSWMDGDLSRQWVNESLKYDTNPWHYHTIGNEPWYDYHWGERTSHPNEIAGRQAMDKCCSLYSCANGRGVYLTQDSECIKRGQLWVKRTMKVVKPPTNPICFLCLDNGKGHILNALNSKKSSYESSLEQAEGNYRKALQYKEDIDFYTKCNGEIEEELAKVKQE